MWLLNINFQKKKCHGHQVLHVLQLLLWCTLLTQLLLSFLSLSRLMTVIYPIDTKFKRIKFVLKSILLFYMSSFLVALFVTLYFKFTYKRLPFNLCLPFIDPSNSVLMINIITWNVAITQTATSVIITVLHIHLVKKLKDSRRKITQTKSQVADALLIFQLIVITSSNIICWSPTNSIYIVAMFLSTYPINLIIWTTVICLTLNSIINP